MAESMQSLDQLSQLKPAAPEAPKHVRKIDKQFIGAAPGLDDGSDRSVKMQLPILGSASD